MSGDRSPAIGPVRDEPDPGERALAGLGWNERRAEQFADHRAQGRHPGRVARVDRGSCLVLGGTHAWRAVPGRSLSHSTDAAPVTGDWVALAPPAGRPEATIEALLPRETAVRRLRGEVQVIASNIDVVFVVMAAGYEAGATSAASRRGAVGPDGRVRRLDRELALAHESGAEPVVVLTKADLCDDSEGVRQAVAGVARDVPVHLVSGLSGDGVAALRAYAAGKRTVAMIGASGVGKSTLVNRLVGDALLATSAVRDADGRGRHTTTARHLVPLPGGGAVIDTPGLRSLGLWDAEAGVARVYRDIEELAGRCRFRDCRHEREPGCAVREAVETGRLDERRLAAYGKLEREVAHEARRADRLARAEEHRRRQVGGRATRQRRRARAKDRWRDDE